MWNLLLSAVMAVPEVAPLSNEVKPQSQNPDSDLTIMKVEKRAASRQYNFGIGKKFDYNQDLIEDPNEESEDSLDEMETKRGAQNRFQFGLGKRIKPEQRFSFGLGKRKPYDNRFQFGLGKRATSKDSRFSFGLGKRRDFDEYIKRRYSFGLGKRSPTESVYSSDSSETP